MALFHTFKDGQLLRLEPIGMAVAPCVRAERCCRGCPLTPRFYVRMRIDAPPETRIILDPPAEPPRVAPA